LTAHQTQLLLQGIELFNNREFFACHEALEEAWLEAAGGEKTFLQGFIQIAVALHHWGNQNRVGARRLLVAGIEKLSAFTPQHESVDVAGLLENLEPLRKRLTAGEQPDDWRPPGIRLAPPQH
jgi:predicted metal-dependent hydrolase